MKRYKNIFLFIAWMVLVLVFHKQTDTFNYSLIYFPDSSHWFEALKFFSSLTIYAFLLIAIPVMIYSFIINRFSKIEKNSNQTKNGSSRSIGLSPRVINEMRKLPINIDGRVINCPSNDNFQHFYSQLQSWTGVKKSFHTTRHTFASRCAMNGWSIAEISAQGGWKNLSILKRYTHIKATHLSKKLAN